MKIAGIIAEYDPFHNGHAYQIAKTKDMGAEAVVVVLGGLLGLVLGTMAETNFRRALMVSRGSYSIFVSSPFCIAFLALTALVIGSVILNKIKGRKKANG